LYLAARIGFVRAIAIVYCERTIIVGGIGFVDACGSGFEVTIGKRVLLVEDDDALREMLAEQLQLHEEFAMVTAAAGAKALELAKVDHFDVIILDIGLPDMDGREVCRLMRRNGIKSPIIMLTGADTDADTILGLDSGANDYVTKPFRLGVLLARLRAHIRQHERSDDAVFGIGPYTFQPSAKLLLNNDTNKKIRLTDKEAAILKYLYRTGSRVISREVLLDEVWGYNAGVTTHTLETHVYRLRQKIEPDPSSARILVTEAGGYRLIP
jgi:DNA-binding response OmpR family regulator